MQNLKKYVTLALALAFALSMLAGCGGQETKAPQSSKTPEEIAVATDKADSILESYAKLPTPDGIKTPAEYTEKFTAYTDLYVEMVDLLVENADVQAVSEKEAELSATSADWINKSYEFESFASEEEAKQFLESFNANYDRIQASLEKLLIK